MKGQFFKGALVGGIGAAIVMATGVGVAATNGNFILGASNSADKKTALSSTVTTATFGLTNTGGGKAATFSVDSGVAPFTVNSATRVSNLNADKLDDINSTGFLRNRVPLDLTGSVDSPNGV